ncbi:outer membrane channel protein TolC [Psychrobium sp. 1_MG-2023]|uniref:outer membrane channel protein TolC n=1 Tax=Psychrobium sp. 1_MG-2023 TaxID=3062624 RepID=UPI000C324EFE|nr:outer membrane channel protein TolC [Psychrobium sp. 1_MG-2023]MDP2561222.1 outer membrane channel protein TolC [Psychrobium sp. 1_MG-2023]PKF55274.1 outer membrane channel protein TolC [Alteromonadales bacterium alter-6D02]
MSVKLSKLMLSLSLSLFTMTASADGLHQIYQQALQGDPKIKQAQAARDQNFAAISESRAVLLPQITGSISIGNGATNAPHDGKGFEWGDHWGGNAQVSLTQQIYSHGSWLNLSLTEKNASRSDAQLASAQQGLILRVANAYFDVLKAKDNLSFVQAEKRAIERQLEQTKQRYEVGLTAFTDVHEAQAQFDISVANEIFAQNTLVNSLESLTEITGLKHQNLDQLNTDTFSPAIPQPATSGDWVKLAQENNLTLLDQRLAVDIAKQRIDLSKSGHLPTLGATASMTHTYNNEGLSQTTAHNHQGSASVGLQLNVPIYNGGRISSQVEQSRLGYVASAQSLEENHRSVVRNIRSSFNDVRASIASINAYSQAATSADSALKATKAGFEVGIRTIVDVLNSTRQVYNAKKQLANARYGYILSVLQLKQTAGTLKEQDLILISKGLIAAETTTTEKE